jgi:protoporphyrinogen oxidase
VEESADNQKKRVLILGAGLAGLSAGWMLRKKGYEVDIIERDETAGGLAITRKDGEFKWDLGPHNIHTHHTHVLSFLKRTFSSLYEHSVPCLIFKNGRFLQYPLKGLKIISSLSPLRFLYAGISFFMARLTMFLSNPKNDNNFEEWIRNRFGSVLFNEYFRDYPRKVWGLEPNKIDKYVAEKRIPIMSLTDLIRTLILRRPSKMSHPEWSSASFYLPDGIGALPEFFEKEFLKDGGRIHFSSVPTKISTLQEKASKIEIQNGSGTKEFETDYLLSTIPINAMIELFSESSSKPVESAKSLDYVASVLLFLKTNKRDVIPAKLLYFSEPEVLFSRVSDVGGFSPKMVPDSQNLLCLEFPCSEGDGVWKMTLEELTEHAVSVMVDRGVLKREEIIGSFVEKITHSYPRFRHGFLDHLKSCHDFINSYDNCLSYGRQGGFAYVNTDAVIHLGFQAADAVVMAKAAGFSLADWFAIRGK